MFFLIVASTFAPAPRVTNRSACSIVSLEVITTYSQRLPLASPPKKKMRSGHLQEFLTQLLD